MSDLTTKIAYWSVTTMLIGSFGWTTLVRSEDLQREMQQQTQLDTLLELQKATLAKACITLPTEQERTECLDKVFPPPATVEPGE